jgi:magnesium-transporting ATPase (P-type)
MFSTVKRFLKHISLLMCAIALIIFFTDKGIIEIMHNPWLYYGSFFVILCMLLILVYALGLPSFDELKDHLERQIMNNQIAEENENGEPVEEQ